MEEFSSVKSIVPPCALPKYTHHEPFFFPQENIDIQKFVQPPKTRCLYLRIRFCLDILEHVEKQELTSNSNLRKKKKKNTMLFDSI